MKEGQEAQIKMPGSTRHEEKTMFYGKKLFLAEEYAHRYTGKIKFFS